MATREVPLFGQQHGPYGDAYLNPDRPGSYHSTMHGIAARGEFMPFFEPTLTALNTSAPFAFECGTPVEWSTSTGAPIVLFSSGVPQVVVWRINSDATVTGDKTFSGAHKIASSATNIASALHSDGSTAPYFFVGFGTTATAEYRNQAGTWAALAGTPSQANGFLSENSNLWAILTNGYQVRKWAAGVNPTSGTASNAVDIGTSAYPITGAGSVARSYVGFVKPDGIYFYDIDTNRYENIWPGLAENPHPDTGKGAFTWGSDLYVPLGWGGMVRVTPSLQVLPASLVPNDARPDHSTPGLGRVRGATGDASYIYAAVEPFQQRMGAEIGLTVLSTTDDAAFTDRTAVATDDDIATSFTPSSTTRIYAGADIRTGGAWANSDAAANSTVILGLDYWNGSAWTAVTTTDFTGGYTRSGALVPAARIPTDWVTNTVNGSTKFWLRLSRASGTYGGNVIRELRALPDVAPLPSGENVSLSGQDEAGLRTHIFRGYPVGDTFHWDDIASIAGDLSHGLIFTQLAAAAGGRSLIAIGARQYARFRLGPTGSPDSQPYADVTNAQASLLRLNADDRIDPDKRAPTTRKGVEYVFIKARYFSQGADSLQAWVSFDGGTPQYLGLSRRSPAKLKVPQSPESGEGYEYAVTAALQDTTRDLRVPVVTDVVAGVYTIAELPE